MNVALITLVLKVDYSILWIQAEYSHELAVINGDYMFGFVFVLLCSWVSFFLVQGSNPGYLSKCMSHIVSHHINLI